MRKAALTICALLLVFAAAFAAGFTAASRVAPERLREQVAQGFTDLLGAPVQLGPAQLTWGGELPWVEMQAAGAQVQNFALGELHVQQLRATINPLGFVFGRASLRGVRLHGARLVLPPPAQNTRGAAAQFTALEAAAAQLRNRPCLGVALEVHKLEVLRARADGGAPRPLLRGAKGALNCAALGLRGAGFLEGVLTFGPGRGAHLRAEVQASAGKTTWRLQSGAAPIAGWIELLRLPSQLTGDVGGSLRWDAPQGAPHVFHANLHGRALRGLVRFAESDALQLNLARPQLQVQAAATPSWLELREAKLQDPSPPANAAPQSAGPPPPTIALEGEARFTLPLQGEAPLHARLAMHGASRADIAKLLAQLPPHITAPLQAPFARVAAGRVEALRVAVDTTADGFAQIAQQGPRARPGEFKLEAQLHGIALQPRAPGAARATGMRARVYFDGNNLQLKEGAVRIDERPPLHFEAELGALAALPGLYRIACARPAPLQLPGMNALLAPQKAGAPSRWRALNLELERLAYPALLCEMQNVAAEVTPLPPPENITAQQTGFNARVARTHWAGLPLSGAFAYRKAGDETHIEINAQLIPELLTPELTGPLPPAAPAAKTPDGTWARGKFALQLNPADPFRMKSLSGELQARGTELSLRRSTLQLDPGGALTGALEFSLAEADATHYSAALQLGAVPIVDLFRATGLESDLFSGTLHGAVALKGKLGGGGGKGEGNGESAPLLAGAEGALSLHARKGHIHSRVPLLFAIATAGVNAAGARDRLRFDALDVVGRLENGVLEINTLTLNAPNLRSAGSGRLDLAHKQELDLVVGLFFFPQLDGLLQKIPIINRIVLGRDRNLVGSYFHLKGPLAKPRARIVAGKSLEQVGAGDLVMAAPALLFGIVQSVGAILLPDAPAAEDEAQPALTPPTQARQAADDSASTARSKRE